MRARMKRVLVRNLQGEREKEKRKNLEGMIYYREFSSMSVEAEKS